MGEELNEGVRCRPRGGEWAAVGGRKEKERKKEKKRFKNNNIIIRSGNIDCSRKIPKNTQK